MRTLLSILSLVAALLIVGGPAALAGDNHQPRFPPEHEDFLSSGARVALFDADRVHPEPGRPGAAISERAAGSRIGPNVRMNNPQCVPNSAPCVPLGKLGRSETTVAATQSAEKILTGWNNADGLLRAPVADLLTGTPGLSAFGFSLDGGLTWTDGGAPPVASVGDRTVVTAGDPWLDRGGLDQSTFFFSNLAVDSQRDPITGGVVPRGISVHRGHFHDHSFTWDDVHLIEPPHPRDLYDKDAIAMAKDGSGLGYVTISNFLELCGRPAFGFGQVEVWRTQDDGSSWQGPSVAGPDRTFGTANPLDPTCGNGGVLQQSSVPAIGPAHEVYVVWQRGPTLTTGAASATTDIVVARSLDNGVSFDDPVTVATINSMRQDPPVGFNKTRINDHPRIAVATSGPQRGRVYVAFPSAVAPVPHQPMPRIDACPPGLDQVLCIPQSLVSTQVLLSFSDDQGRTWSAPTPIGSPVPPSGLKRWWPVVSVEPNGAVDVVYYESQEKIVGTGCDVPMPSFQGLVHEVGPAVSLVDTFWARSTDGGASFGPAVRVSTATSNWCATQSSIPANFGDYIGSVAVGGRVLMTWADGRAGVPDAFFAAGRATGSR